MDLFKVDVECNLISQHQELVKTLPHWTHPSEHPRCRLEQLGQSGDGLQDTYFSVAHCVSVPIVIVDGLLVEGPLVIHYYRFKHHWLARLYHHRQVFGWSVARGP